MTDYTKLVDTSKEIKANTSSKSWKHIIIEYLLTQPNHTAPIKEVLTNTDPKYTVDNYSKRKHCLDSQKTYMKQDLNVIAEYNDTNMRLIGVLDPKKDVIHPFKSSTPKK